MSPKKTSLFCILYLFNTCIASKADIDKDHYDMFPYCGKIHPAADQTNARAINAEDSKDTYRWAALFVRVNTQPKDGKKVKSICSGTIISDRWAR